MALDVGFLIYLAALLAPPLLRSRSRNTPLLLVLMLLAACNAAFHWALMQRDAGAASHAVRAWPGITGITIVLMISPCPDAHRLLKLAGSTLDGS